MKITTEAPFPNTCLSCGKPLSGPPWHMNMEDITGYVGDRGDVGIMFDCPHCHTRLSVQCEAITYETMEELQSHVLP